MQVVVVIVQILLISLSQFVANTSCCFANGGGYNSSCRQLINNQYFPQRYTPSLDLYGHRLPDHHHYHHHHDHVQFPQRPSLHEQEDPHHHHHNHQNHLFHDHHRQQYPLTGSGNWRGGGGHSYPNGYLGPQNNCYGCNQNMIPVIRPHLHEDHHRPSRFGHLHNHHDPHHRPLPPQDFQRRTYLIDRPSGFGHPIFLGRGVFGIVGRDAELACHFVDPRFKVVSNIGWVKVDGPYSYPSFSCRHAGCKFVDINHLTDFRYRVMSSGHSSVLRIYDHNIRDHGVYRCSATGQGRDGNIETIYQIIEFYEPFARFG